MSGRRASGYVIQALDGSSSLHLPTLIECNEIPNVREEIPTPETAIHHPHLRDIAEYIPPIDSGADILLLIGRDLLAAHHVLDHRIGLPDAPYAQKLHLGWAIIGEVCLGQVHKPDVVIVNKTHMLRDGRTTIMEPCPNNFEVNERNDFEESVFQKTRLDETQTLSIEDKQFLRIMDAEFSKDSDGCWTAPLPFRQDRARLPCNKFHAIHRAKLLDSSMCKDQTKREHMTTFMVKVIDKGHAEIAPPLEKDQECWYLPLFGVYNAKKPGQIRGVFDSSAKYNGVSLNSVLMTGPDLTNNLLGILLRFRTESFAVTADVEQMFYCFKVKPSHRDYLRFFWYRNNDPSQDLIEYRMTAHVFGNSPSPAVATYGLRRSVENADVDVKWFVENDFYVDDGLLSVPTEEKAIDLIQRTQSALQHGGNIRLHKIASNSRTVLAAFDAEDLAKDIKDLDFNTTTPPPQRSLGLSWDINKDTFTFQVCAERKPFTRRGVLSTINSLYDPVGFAAPVVIKEKLLLRELMSTTSGWDDPLPSSYLSQWQNWCDSLKNLENVVIPRPYSKI
ncbi:uncharacterized protein LOC124126721 [Haliotis rufescens]|uniref:uncharacterized protein LOC124126721 n=1 Tax=Haliotis rufescens TaxID=6454 RepID=UPI00201E77B8|nr:uncharacterized protein LOC124126721 [Haliotis rufescens]